MIGAGAAKTGSLRIRVGTEREDEEEEEEEGRQATVEEERRESFWREDWEGEREVRKKPERGAVDICWWREVSEIEWDVFIVI